MITLLIRLFAGQFFREAGGEIRAGWQWLFAAPTHILEALLALAVAFGLYERHEAAQAQSRATACQQAAATNHAAQIAIAQRPAIITRTIAESIDDQSPAYLAAVSAAGRAYAAAHPAIVRTAPGSGGAPSVPVAGGAAQSHDGPGLAPGLVAVPTADFDRYTAAIARLDQVHAAAQAMIDQGVAVPDTAGAQ